MIASLSSSGVLQMTRVPRLDTCLTLRCACAVPHGLHWSLRHGAYYFLAAVWCAPAARRDSVVGEQVTLRPAACTCPDCLCLACGRSENAVLGGMRPRDKQSRRARNLVFSTSIASEQRLRARGRAPAEQRWGARAVIYLVLRKPGVGSPHFWASWTCIVLGVAVTILGSLGGCAPASSPGQPPIPSAARKLFFEPRAAAFPARSPCDRSVKHFCDPQCMGAALHPATFGLAECHPGPSGSSFPACMRPFWAPWADADLE